MVIETPVCTFTKCENGKELFKIQCFFNVEYSLVDRSWGEILEFGKFCNYIKANELVVANNMLDYSNYDKYIRRLSDYWHSEKYFDDLDQPMAWPIYEERELKVERYFFSVFNCLVKLRDDEIGLEIDFQRFCKSLLLEEHVVLSEMIFQDNNQITENYKNRILQF